MKRFVLPRFIFYPVALAVVVVALFGIGVTWRAQSENYRLGLAVNQILRVVMRARDLRVSRGEDPARAQKIFVESLAQWDGEEIMSVEDSATGLAAPALVNPWGGALKVAVIPGAKRIRLETRLSSNNCRRVLTYFAKDSETLRLRKVEVMRDLSFDLWTLVYEHGAESGFSASMNAQKISHVCGEKKKTAISLTFGLDY